MSARLISYFPTQGGSRQGRARNWGRPAGAAYPRGTSDRLLSWAGTRPVAVLPRPVSGWRCCQAGPNGPTLATERTIARAPGKHIKRRDALGVFDNTPEVKAAFATGGIALVRQGMHLG